MCATVNTAARQTVDVSVNRALLPCQGHVIGWRPHCYAADSHPPP